MFYTDLELPDGIGSQIIRKISAIYYCELHGHTYIHRPIQELMWHPGDCFDIEDEKQKAKVIKQINMLITPPIQELPKTEKLLTVPTAFDIPKNSNSYKIKFFKKLPMKKRIVIHVRRGNIVADQSINPRYISDEAYRKFFLHLEKIIQDFKLQDREIVVLTDGPINFKETIKTPDHNFWKNQSGMGVEGDTATLIPFNTSILNKNLKYTVLNNLCAVEAMELMLSAEWLFASYSAFSTAIAAGGHYKSVVNTRCINPAGFTGSWKDNGDSVTIDIGGKIYSDADLNR